MDIYNFQHYLNDAINSIPYGNHSGEFWPFFSIFLSIFLIILAVSLIFSLVGYIFNAIGLYTMAKNRQMEYPWLAFIPIANNYTLGSLINDEVSVGSWHIPHAKIFLTLLTFASTIAIASLSMIPYLGTPLMILVSLAAAFYYFAALFQLYRTYDDANRVVFLVLSILIPFLKPIFIFAIRNKKALNQGDSYTEIRKPPVDSKSVIGLCLGIISIISIFPLVGSSLFPGTVGLIFSILAMKELKAQEKKYGLALAGLICSIVGLVLTTLLFFACLACIGLGGFGLFNHMLYLY